SLNGRRAVASATLVDVLHRLRKLADEQASEDLTDTELLERFRCHREETAFALLLQRHGPMVLGVCLRVLGNVHDAEDAFQATFLVLARKGASIRDRESLGSWLYRVAQRVALRARAVASRNRERRSVSMPRAESLDEITWRELR